MTTVFLIVLIVVCVVCGGSLLYLGKRGRL